MRAILTQAAPDYARRIVTFIAIAFLVSGCAHAQGGGSAVTVTASVSETVTLSMLPISADDVDASITGGGSSVTLSLSGSAGRSRVLRVPLIVRSNSAFRISAVLESKTSLLSQLSVVDVRATGTLASPLAVNEVDVPQQFDLRGADENSSAPAIPLDVSGPVIVLSGPRVSLGGALNSPQNALQVTLLLRIRPPAAMDELVQLTFVGTTINGL